MTGGSAQDRRGQTYRVERRIIGPKGIMIAVMDGPRLVGRFVYDPNRHVVTEALIYAEADKRQGIATAIYNLLEAEVGRPLKPSPRLLGDGKAFWAARRGR